MGVVGIRAPRDGIRKPKYSIEYLSLFKLLKYHFELDPFAVAFHSENRWFLFEILLFKKKDSLNNPVAKAFE